MIDIEQSTQRFVAQAEQFRRGAEAAATADAMWPDPEVEAIWQARGRRIGNPLLTAALDLLDDGFAVLPLTPGEKDPLFGGVKKGWFRKARQVVDRWTEFPEANFGVLTGAAWGLVVIDLDGPDALAWWEAFQHEHGTISTRTARTGRENGGLHVHLRVPDKYRHARLKGGNGLFGPGVDVKADGGLVVVPPSMHPSGRRYEWIDRGEMAPLPEVLLEALSEPEGGGRSERKDSVRDPRGNEENAARSLDGFLAQVEQVETTALGRKVLLDISRELAECPESGGPYGGRDRHAYWAYGRIGHLVGSGLINPAEGLDALAQGMDANGLGRSLAKLHRFWERVAEGTKTPYQPPRRDRPEKVESGVDDGGSAGSMSDLSDETSIDLYSGKSDIEEGAGRGALPSRTSRTPPTASPLATRLWEEGTFCAKLGVFASSARRLRKKPAPCGRMDCEPCQRRLLAARAETAARWLLDRTEGVLQVITVEPEAWSSFHKRLTRADAEYLKMPTPVGLVVLFWCAKPLAGSEVLGGTDDFEERLETAWWANRSMTSQTRVDSSKGWQPPKKPPAEDDWQHLGVRSKALAENIAQQFIPTGSTTSPPLDDQQLRFLQRHFPEADLGQLPRNDEEPSP